MNVLTNFMRRLSGNHVAHNYFKEGIKEMLKQAIDNDDEDALQEATAMFYELRGNGRLLPEPTSRQEQVPVNTCSVAVLHCTDDDALRDVVAAVMFSCHKMGILTVSSYDLFDRVDVEMARRGGWTEDDLVPVPHRSRNGTPRPRWRESLSRALSQMKLDGELVNPTIRENRSYCLGPQLLRRLQPAKEPITAEIKALHTTPLPINEGLPDWQAIS